MTPAVELVRAEGVEHQVIEYEHDARSAAFGEEAALKMGVSRDQVFKTLVASLDGVSLVVAVLPVSSTLNLKSLAKTAGAKKAEMALKEKVIRQTGYVLGGVSPLGQKKRLPTYIDESAKRYEAIYVSAGKRGLEIRIAPQDLIRLTEGQFVKVASSDEK